MNVQFLNWDRIIDSSVKAFIMSVEYMVALKERKKLTSFVLLHFSLLEMNLRLACYLNIIIDKKGKQVGNLITRAWEKNDLIDRGNEKFT